jgi:hypothetical protein
MGVRMTAAFLWCVVFMTACVSPAVRRPAPPPPLPVPATERAPEDAQERDHLARLNRAAATWDDRLNVVIAALETELQESGAALGSGLGPTEQEAVARKQALLSSYLEGMKRLKVYQERLRQKDTALSREIVYWDVIDRYLSNLRQGEELRRAQPLKTPVRGDRSDTIKNEFTQGNYAAVIELYRGSSARQESSGGAGAVCYVLSLARTGEAAEANGAAGALLQWPPEISSDTAPLWYELGEWLINVGQTAWAQQVFQRLLGYYESEQQWYAKVKEKSALFGADAQSLTARNKADQALEAFQRNQHFAQAYALALEARTSCPDFACQQQAQAALNQLIGEGTAFLDRSLTEIDAALAASELQNALRIVSTLKEAFPGEDYPPAIREKLALVKDKERFLQRQGNQVQAQGQERTLLDATALMEAQKYEEAIARLDQLQGSTYQFEAQQKKQEAIDGFARTRRLRAGQLFLQAQRCEDPGLKKKYLIESYALLKGVLDAYPSNGYAEKINRNLEDVRAEILRIDPAYFSSETAPGAGSSAGEESPSPLPGAP